MFFNIDPPYVEKGQKLYTNFFREDDHRRLEGVIANSLNETEWIITYDNCELIKEIYRGYHMEEYDIQHNARKSIIGKEIVITNIPQEHFVW
jgi:DNA adenine methylase